MVLLRAGAPVADDWRELGEEAVPQPGGAWIVPLARWRQERERLLASGARLGLRLPPEAALDETLLAALPHLRLVALEFPKFRDGRGFTLARALREQAGWQGEIRAVGHLIPDQYQFLDRVGVTSVALPEGANLESWRAAYRRFSIGYQRGGTRLGPLSRRLPGGAAER